MQLDREKALKLVIVALATLAALAVMSTLVQLIQTVLPFLIVGAGIFAAYRWALTEAPAPSAEEVEEQARGIFSRFRRTKKVVEATVKAGEALSELGGEPAPAAEASEKKERRRSRRARRAERKQAETAPAPEQPAAAKEEAAPAERESKIQQMKQALDSNPEGKIAFKDHDVVISADDIVAPDISRLQEKEKEKPEVNKSVLDQIEERKRRLHGG